MNLEKFKLIRDFFDKYYWRQHPEAALRYAPVVDVIKKARLTESKILEIGPGSLGIVPYLKRKIVGVDVDFSGPKTDLLEKIKGSAIKLPFKRSTFDVSLSVDVLEHLENALRYDAIWEQLRVTKKLAVIVVPSGASAEKQDKELQSVWNKTFQKKNQFIEEHVSHGLPTADEILVFIDKASRKLDKKVKVTSFNNLNLNVRYILMRTWITKSKLLYYLYLKGYLLLIPILKFCNFGKTYRRVFVIEFQV